MKPDSRNNGIITVDSFDGGKMTHRRKLKDSSCMFEVTEIKYDKREKEKRERERNVEAE